jgi:hypothetical protein
MSHKLLPRLGSAIASTILSYAAVSVAGIDQVQAAVLTFNFQVEEGAGSGFFKLSDSSLTRIGSEQIAVSEGRFNTFLAFSKTYYDLAGAIALFNQGNFRGLQASGGESGTTEVAVGGGDYIKVSGRAAWYMGTEEASSLGTWASYFSGAREAIYSTSEGYYFSTRTIISSARVSYSLVDTEPEPGGEPVPEPLTAGGTALALAGLSWLKHKKKMAA